METEKISGVGILLKCLQDQGVELIFGYPGGAVLPLYDGLYDCKIPNILTRHEQGAVHAAQGYAKSTGKPGVVVVTSGPGATNAITGIADAMSDSVPIIIFTGQVGTAGIGKDAFQEADVLGMTLPITKHNYQVRDVAMLKRVVDEAFHIATTGRMGPVLIDLPKNITLQELPLSRLEKSGNAINMPSYQPTLTPSHQQVQKLMQKLAYSHKPLLLVGAGAIPAGAEIFLFAKRYGLPVVSTLLGLGVIPSDYEYFLGMGGMHGSFSANMALCECDLLINIGSRFDDRLASSPSHFAPHACIAHIDIDPAEIGKIISTDIPIVGDSKNAIKQMLEAEIPPSEIEQWQKLCLMRKQRHPFGYKDSTEVIKPQKVIEIIGKITKNRAYVATDVGQHQMWVAQFYPFSFPRQLVTSGGLGTMGYGIPAGIGIAFAHRDADVVVFVGDGGFQMTNQELAILNENELNVKFVLFNNKVLGMVHQWQGEFHNKRYSASEFSTQPDFMLLAKAYGIAGVRIENPLTLEGDLARAFAHKGSIVIEVLIPRDESVLPMVPSGMPNDKMIGVQ